VHDRYTEPFVCVTGCVDRCAEQLSVTQSVIKRTLARLRSCCSPPAGARSIDDIVKCATRCDACLEVTRCARGVSAENICRSTKSACRHHRSPPLPVRRRSDRDPSPPAFWADRQQLPRSAEREAMATPWSGLLGDVRRRRLASAGRLRSPGTGQRGLVTSPTCVGC
jgi:hypothetical protein